MIVGLYTVIWLFGLIIIFRFVLVLLCKNWTTNIYYMLVLLFVLKVLMLNNKSTRLYPVCAICCSVTGWMLHELTAMPEALKDAENWLSSPILQKKYDKALEIYQEGSKHEPRNQELLDGARRNDLSIQFYSSWDSFQIGNQISSDFAIIFYLLALADHFLHLNNEWVSLLILFADAWNRLTRQAGVIWRLTSSRREGWYLNFWYIWSSKVQTQLVSQNF